MSLNVIDLIKGQLGPALISQAASQFGESESGISKAISGLLPAVVGGLANNANNPGVLDAITSASSNGILGNLLGGSTTNNSWISSLLSLIFGDKVNGLVNSIATFAGISNNTSSSLLNLVTGATLGSVGKYASDNNLDRNGISTLLGDQKGLVSNLLPAGLSLASLGSLFGGDSHTEKITTTTYDQPKVEVTRGTSSINSDYKPGSNPNNEGGGSIWKWLLPLILAVAAAYFLWQQCNKPKETTAVTTSTDTLNTGTDSTVITTTTETVAPTKVDEDIDLNGVALKGYKNGLEDRMITFLKTDGYKNAADDDALKTVWYDFDHVNFKMGSNNQLEAGSEGQLENLLAILKAYPDAKVKIGGYTDKTGNEDNNKKLSKERAEFIKKWLSDKGVGAQVLGADGYGSEFATVDASASDAERAIDRKMSVRFAK